MALPARDEPGAETYERWLMARFRAEALSLASLYPGRCRMLEMTTDEAALVVPDASVDFVFVDADHTEEAVARDIATWTPKVRPGGLIAGHNQVWIRWIK
jgi:predicted O-methyltransferase YrrM